MDLPGATVCDLADGGKARHACLAGEAREATASVQCFIRIYGVRRPDVHARSLASSRPRSRRKPPVELFRREGRAAGEETVLLELHEGLLDVGLAHGELVRDLLVQDGDRVAHVHTLAQSVNDLGLKPGHEQPIVRTSTIAQPRKGIIRVLDRCWPGMQSLGPPDAVARYSLLVQKFAANSTTVAHRPPVGAYRAPDPRLLGRRRPCRRRAHGATTGRTPGGVKFASRLPTSEKTVTMNILPLRNRHVCVSKGQQRRQQRRKMEHRS